MSPIISVENLSKAYRIGAKEEVPDTLVGAAKGILKAPFKNLSRLRGLDTSASSDEGSESDILWALKDVSFEVNEGDVVGIIGRNGAGKSTLLKVLSRITEPTSGRAVIRGRVSSLLEVGTGFHPELTGRENVYMNGTILGMTKKEIDRKFDEIVDFSGVEKFLDTPTKRYSSGMRVRLAFAVAAHLEPEILIVDEVLAVGDVQFQKRCIGKMHEVAKTGRTVLFVSHNMAAVESLCSDGIMLTSGQVSLIGSAKEVVERYREQAFSSALAPTESVFSDSKYIQFAELVNEKGDPTSHIPLGTLFRLKMRLFSTTTIEVPKIGIGIDTVAGERLLSIHNPTSRRDVDDITGSVTVICDVKQFPLAPGSYVIRIVLTENGQELEAIDNAVQFHIVDGDAFGEGRGFHRGLVVAPSQWSSSSV